MHNVAVLNDIFFALDANLSGFAALAFAAKCNIVVILDNLGADEALLEVGMDDAGTLRGFTALDVRPRLNLLRSGSEIRFEVEKMKRRTNQSRHARLL